VSAIIDWNSWSHGQIWLMVAFLGAGLGSFANVLIYRLPRNLGVVAGRSFCPACKHRVAWYDNIPLLSWIVLRGRCRHCSATIPVRYLLVECCGVLCALIGIWRFGPTAAGVAAFFFLLWLAVVAVIDWEHMIIPHTLTVSGMLVALSLAEATGIGIGRAALGLAVGAGAVLMVAYGYQLVRGRTGMGGGDVMLMGMVGAFLGPWPTLLVLFGGALLGTIYILIRYRGQLVADAKLPFGTFLATAAGIVLLCGDAIFHWYFGLFPV